MAARSHLFPFRTEKLSSLSPMVLNFGRVGSRRFQESISLRLAPFLFLNHRVTESPRVEPPIPLRLSVEMNRRCLTGSVWKTPRAGMRALTQSYITTEDTDSTEETHSEHLSLALNFVGGLTGASGRRHIAERK